MTKSTHVGPVRLCNVFADSSGNAAMRGSPRSRVFRMVFLTGDIAKGKYVNY
jgi:hypothetical protein